MTKRYYLIYLRLPSYSFCVLRVNNIRLPDHYNLPKTSSRAYITLKIRSKFFKYNEQFVILASQLGFRTFLGSRFFIFDEDSLNIFLREFENLKNTIMQKIAEEFEIELQGHPKEIQQIFREQYKAYFSTERFKIYTFEIHLNDDVVKSVLMTLYSQFERLNKIKSPKKKREIIENIKKQLQRIFEFFQYPEELRNNYISAITKFTPESNEDDFLAYLDTILEHNNNVTNTIKSSLNSNDSLIQNKKSSLKYVLYKLEQYYFEYKKGKFISLDEAIQKIREWTGATEEEAHEILQELNRLYSEDGFSLVNLFGEKGIWFDRPILYVLAD